MCMHAGTTFGPRRVGVGLFVMPCDPRLVGRAHLDRQPQHDSALDVDLLDAEQLRLLEHGVGDVVLEHELVRGRPHGLTGRVHVRSVRDGQVDGDQREAFALVADPEDLEILSDMVLAAVNEGLRMAQDLAAKKLGGASGGLDLGNLGGLGLPGL